MLQGIYGKKKKKGKKREKKKRKSRILSLNFFEILPEFLKRQLMH